MRISVLPLLLAGASVVGLVAAEPIRVIEVPSNANANIRLGLALANANVNGNDDDVARIVRPSVPLPPNFDGKNQGFGRHFCGASLREKAIRLSNTLRHALGFPLIEADVELPRPAHIHILPVGYPNVNLHSQDEMDEKHGEHHGLEHPGDVPDGDHHGRHGHHGDHDHDRHDHHGHHGHHRKHHKSFLRRIHRAIKALGPWEGRAVAFVLGCGIGVLLRMFWVLSVLAYRTVRGEREETFDREYVVYEHVPETLSVAPPEYVDEKISLEAHEEVEESK